MSAVTDEDFLNALESDPWLYAAATQPSSGTETEPSSDSQSTKTSLPPNGEEPLSSTALIAAQGRRRNIIARIESAMDRWKPTLQETLPQNDASGMPTDNEGSAVKIRKSNYFQPNNVTEKEVLGRFVKHQDNSTKSHLGLDGSELDSYQLEAIRAARAGQSFFLTGSAGTGKSYVLKAIIRELRSQGKNVAVTASTGCAAVGIRGCTIHSFAGVGLGLEAVEILARRAMSDRRIRARFEDLHTLIIDEISMIDSFLFDKIEAVARAARSPNAATRSPNAAKRQRRDREKQKRKRKWEDPFGGLQVIVCGDFFQLPPVAASDRRYQHSSKKFFVFDSEAWQKTIKRTFMLQHVHRQGDLKFVGLLNEVRQGFVSKSTREVLHCCQVEARRNVEVDSEGKVVHFTKLFAFRRQVATENTSQLLKLKVQGVHFICRDFVDRSALGTLTTRIVEQMLANTSAPDAVELRKGARVLCLKNLDQQKGIVNGTGGEIIGWALSLISIFQKRKAAQEKMGSKEKAVMPTAYDLQDEDIFDLHDEQMVQNLKAKGIMLPQDGALTLQGGHSDLIAPVVRFDNGVVRHMQPEEWEVHGMQGQVVGMRKQIPLMLGWALSIHRAQGMTLGEVETDVGRAFDCGQVYVALSRATSVQGLRLRSFDPSKVVAHEKVTGFYRTLLTGMDSRNNAAAQSRQLCGS